MNSHTCFVETRWGGSEVNPGLARLQQIIAELQTRDEEHPDTWLTHAESEWTLRLNEDRFAYLEDPDGDIVSHLRNVGPDQALKLWIGFAEGGRESVLAEPWLSGPPVLPDEVVQARQAQARQITGDGDRRFYEVLGTERADVHCKKVDCGRGAISGSVFCRKHHFEQIYRRPCPFDD